ncbi:hypothetical protein F5Y16DRAFT_166950 [Xylariaceae sp. FL0255]|nr:hypothetical protein F5Y16DRAFT_166950 [Xylariaceae sp. FL0255]
MLMLAFLFCWVRICLAQLPKTTSIPPGGGPAQYAGVVVDVYNPLPTLIYNCDDMAAICWNAAEMLADPSNAALNALNPKVFHYDTDSSHTATRNSASCPGTWQNQLPATCGSVPGQPNVQPGSLPPNVAAPGVAHANAGFPGGMWTPEFNNEITNAAGNGPSGMVFTCEEFPSASFIEGGVDPNIAPIVHINCAPKALSCQGNFFNAVQAKFGAGVYPNVQSEQDWQAKAHNAMRNYAIARAKANNNGAALASSPVMKFVWSTTNIGAGATAAQLVLPGYPNGAAQVAATTNDIPVKRSAGALGPRLKCEGSFCHNLVADGFVFHEIEVPAEPTPVSYLPEDLGAHQWEKPEQTDMPAATLHVLI